MKKYFFRLFILIPIICFFNSCRKDIDSYPDKNLISPQTKLIAHKAGGGSAYSQFRGNSLEAAVYGFVNAEGIEIDIQKSRDNTLWLFHDEYFVECNGDDRYRIPGLKDAEIKMQAPCMGYPQGLTQLEEIYIYHRNNNLNKKISLDIKSWLPTKFSNTPLYLIKLANDIIQLTKKYKMEPYIFVECENATCLNTIKKSGLGIETYLTTMGDFDNGMSKALKAGYTGLSFRYDPTNPPSHNDMSLLRQKGLKIQFFTINDKAEILKAMELQPDYIQTDNILLQ